MEGLIVVAGARCCSARCSGVSGEWEPWLRTWFTLVLFLMKQTSLTTCVQVVLALTDPPAG